MAGPRSGGANAPDEAAPAPGDGAVAPADPPTWQRTPAAVGPTPSEPGTPGATGTGGGDGEVAPDAAADEPAAPVRPVQPGITGTWEIMGTGSGTDRRLRPASGLMVVNRTHLVLYIERPTVTPGRPQLRTVVRRYTLEADRLRMQNEAGHVVDYDGDVELERPHTITSLQMEWREGGTQLRLYTEDGDFLQMQWVPDR